MPRRGPRVRIATGIYQDGGGVSAIVSIGHQATEKRFSLGTSLKTIRAWQNRQRNLLRQHQPHIPRGSLAADAERYYRQIQHLTSWRERRCEIRAWVKVYGPLHRSRITAMYVRELRGQWAQAGVAPKTINHRVAALRHLYRTLDGPTASTPCDDVTPMAVPRTVPVAVSAQTILDVEAMLRQHEQAGQLRDQKTRARFMVLASTGKRPSELMRAQPTDVDLERRVWAVRDGKGGWSPGLYLNDDMRAAWQVFIDATAWGYYETSSFARVLRTAGWPAGIRPYQLRHSVGIALSEQGEDLSDVQAIMGRG